MKILRRMLLVVSLFALGSVLTACSEIVGSIKEQVDAQDELIAYIDDSNPVIETAVDAEIAADEFVFMEEDLESAYTYLVETTIPTLEKVVEDTEAIVITMEDLQPSHDKLIEAHKKLLEAYSTYADGYYDGDESLLEKGDLLYEEYGGIYDEHETLFTELAKEYNLEVEIEEVE
ncbi:hypothetical protein [Sutcliffiella horikoshii]|uniref:Lipoprotein n=1 Tax=Sutcliffiella horikoshii TaxID=79883 RepID=A0A5D4SZ75_9BACI|nr:hypothetical protein [Sutcliffiella horikoshii]TYS67314.1 hypothetical protein FZC75_18900 [Sutcliffiella horikoshii]